MQGISHLPPPPVPPHGASIAAAADPGPSSRPTGEAMPASVSAAGLQLAEDGVAQTKFTGDASMHQLGEVMKMQMKQQTEMALMKLIVSMNEALAKEIKKTGDAVKNLAG
jgi:hypothetical protein